MWETNHVCRWKMGSPYMYTRESGGRESARGKDEWWIGFNVVDVHCQRGRRGELN